MKRAYTAVETAELLQQMREGVCVPRCAHHRCIDLMVEVMSNMALHVQAAEGYIKTSMTVCFDGTQDHFIVREAWFFWQELNMRAKNQHRSCGSQRGSCSRSPPMELS